MKRARGELTDTLLEVCGVVSTKLSGEDSVTAGEDCLSIGRPLESFTVDLLSVAAVVVTV